MSKDNFKKISKKEFDAVLQNEEGDYSDFANSLISGSKLQEKIVAFANSEGGDIYVGIHDRNDHKKDRNDGFDTVESASKVIDAAYRDIIPNIDNLEHEFVKYDKKIIARLIIPSSTQIHKTIKGDVFIRKGAQKVKLHGDSIKLLKYKKGVDRYEDQVKNADLALFSSSKYFREFLKKIGFSGGPQKYLKRNNFVYDNKPKLSAILCFLDSPQSVTKSGIKIIRYEHQKYSRKYAYRRERVSDKDYTIEGPIEILIREGIKKIYEVMPKNIKYPKEAILESLANAVLHRDYYIQNEIQVKIYDNRIEIVSPGGFAGGITVKNISNHERFARNPMVFRTLFKISSLEKKKENRLNQDQGEGIKTIFNSMRKAGLSDPEFDEKDNCVVVILKHENMESYESKIVEYLKNHNTIANKEAREVTGEEDKEKIKNVFKKLVKRGDIDVIDNPSKSKIRYKLKDGRSTINKENKQLKMF